MEERRAQRVVPVPDSRGEVLLVLLQGDQKGVCLEILDPLDALCEGPGHLAAEAGYAEGGKKLRAVIGGVDLQRELAVAARQGDREVVRLLDDVGQDLAELVAKDRLVAERVEALLEAGETACVVPQVEEEHAGIGLVRGVQLVVWRYFVGEETEVRVGPGRVIDVQESVDAFEERRFASRSSSFEQAGSAQDSRPGVVALVQLFDLPATLPQVVR